MFDYVHDNFGLIPKDAALFLGGFLVILAVLILGWYGGRPRRRWAGNIGWMFFWGGSAVIVWGMVGRAPPQ